MILLFIRRNINLIFILVSGTRPLKLLEFPKWWQSYLLLWQWGDFLKTPKDWGWLSGEPLISWKGGNFRPLLHLWGGVRGWRLNQSSVANALISCIFYNEASIKPPKGWRLESYEVGEPVEMWVEWCTCRGHGGSPPFPHTLPCASLLGYILLVKCFCEFRELL